MEARDESGQIIVIVLVLVVLLASLGPIMVSSITSDTPLLSSSTNSHAALAAVEAGIQWYRDSLNTDPNYFSYTNANNPIGDPALSGYCSAACDLGSTNPPEAFHYVPNNQYLYAQTGNAAGSIVLTVTGRAGTPGNYAYVTAQTNLSTSSVLDNAYFSNYEVLDPNSKTASSFTVTEEPTGCGSSSSCFTSAYETTTDILYSYTAANGTTVQANSGNLESLWAAMCLYDSYQPNTFIDSLGLGYSYLHPYYGAYFSNTGFSFTTNGNTLASGTSGTTTVTVSGLPCGAPYDFVNGETFNGPVYTNDQLHVCGSPSFNGAPISYQSGAPNNVPYLWNTPGATQITNANSSLYPGVPVGDYVPAGYTTDNVNCAGSLNSVATPNLKQGLALNVNQSLPSLNSNLALYGGSVPPTGTGYGCTYVGPTMIELVTSGTTTTMNVWSPLSSDSAVTTSSCSGGSTFSTSNPFITGIPLPTDKVIYVNNYTLKSGTAPPTVNDGSTPCFNPYQSSASVTSGSCYEGDVYIEGELSGQLTVASAANIMVTRNITYACASGSGPASSTNPSSVTACATEATPDLLGLSAQTDVLISGNNPSNTGASTQNCSSNGFGDGTGAPVNVPTSGQTSRAPYTADAALSHDPAAVWPTLCNPQNVIIDAAIFALGGSFGVENWDTTPQSGGAYLNGTDLGQYRGPFGYVGSTGYTKQFSFDQRLKFAAPPDSLQSAVANWQVGDYVVCPLSSCPAIS